MQGLPPKDDFNPLRPSLGNHSHEGTIHSHPESETRSVGHPDHQVEGEVEVIEEGFLSSNDLPLTDPIGPLLLEMHHLTNSVSQELLQTSPTKSLDNFAHYLQQTTSHLPWEDGQAPNAPLPMTSLGPNFPSSSGVSSTSPLSQINLLNMSTSRATTTPLDTYPNLPLGY